LPILLSKDTENFEKSLIELKYSTFPPDLDALKILTLPTVDSPLIKCQYFIKIHLSYISGKMKADLKAPILVCRPILGVAIPTLPSNLNQPGAQMMTPEKVPDTASIKPED
jgi:hypothetical protein